MITMENEIWRDVVGYEELYQVSNLGRVKSLARVINRSGGSDLPVKEKILKSTLNSKGYMVVCLSKNGAVKTNKVHQLVAIAFLGHEPSGMKLIINHKDYDKTNNNADNLELVSTRYNSSVDQWRHSRTSKYIGVSLKGHYKDGSPRWLAAITINNKTKYLGCFKIEEEASQAYQSALEQLN